MTSEPLPWLLNLWTFFKIGPSLFIIYFRLFNTVDREQYKEIPDDRIRTADL